MIAELTSAAQSAKMLIDILKAAKDLRNYNELAAAVSEIYSKLLEAHDSALSAYQAQASQAERLGELEKEILELKDWTGEAERYRLGEIGPGLLAFSLKPGKERGEPPHYLCANCYNKKEKSFLQITSQDEYGRTYECHNCKSELHIVTGQGQFISD